MKTVRYDDFRYNLEKFVRKNHVRISERWLNEEAIQLKKV